MVNWEFWGSKKAWKAIGLGVLLIILGFLLIAAGIGLGAVLVIVGVPMVGIAGYYLVVWENWQLLKGE